MARPIRRWKAFCPQCDQSYIYPELARDEVCSTLSCTHCGTEFVCPSYRFDCNQCKNIENCMELPSAESIIYRSTWRGFFHARCLGFKKLAARDLQCLFYLREEEKPKHSDPDLPTFSRLQNKPATRTIKTDTRTFVFGIPQHKPEFTPKPPRIGFFGRRDKDVR